MNIRLILTLAVVGVLGFGAMWFITGLSDPVAATAGTGAAFLVILPLGLAIGCGLSATGS